MQEFIEDNFYIDADGEYMLNWTEDTPMTDVLNKVLKKEKEQIIQAHKIGWEDCQEYIKTIGQTTRKGKKYYNQTYNQKSIDAAELLYNIVKKEVDELNKDRYNK